jgi:hypothetical protein
MKRYADECDCRLDLLADVRRWTLKPSDRRAMDRYYAATRGPTSLTRKNAGPMENRPKMKMHTWLRFLLFLMPVLLYPALEKLNGIPNVVALTKRYFDCVTECVQKIIDPTTLPNMKTRIRRAARAFMSILPSSECGLLLHLTTHGPEMIAHLGPVNGYHMFPFESFFGFIKRFVQSKSNPEANIIMCYRIIVFGHILKARFPGALKVSNVGDLLVNQEPSSDEDSDGDDSSRYAEGVVAPLRSACRTRRKLTPVEQESLFILLGYQVHRTCRDVKGVVTVDGQRRGSGDMEDVAVGRVARYSGVTLPPEHLPRKYTSRRFGVIRYMAYVSDQDVSDHSLVACVQVFRKRKKLAPKAKSLSTPVSHGIAHSSSMCVT